MRVAEKLVAPSAINRCSLGIGKNLYRRGKPFNRKGRKTRKGSVGLYVSTLVLPWRPSRPLRLKGFFPSLQFKPDLPHTLLQVGIGDRQDSFTLQTQRVGRTDKVGCVRRS